MSCESESVSDLAEPSPSVFLTDEHGKRMTCESPRAFAVDTGARGNSAPAADRGNIGLQHHRHQLASLFTYARPERFVLPRMMSACRMSETACGLKKKL